MEVLRKHGADPERTLAPDGCTLVVDGDTDQYIAVLKAACELRDTANLDAT